MHQPNIRSLVRERIWFVAVVALFLTGFVFANLPLEVECIGRPTIFHAGEQYPRWTTASNSTSDQTYRLAGFPRRYFFSQHDPGDATTNLSISVPAIIANALALVAIVILVALELRRTTSTQHGRWQWSFLQVLLLTLSVSCFMMWTVERGIWNPKGLAQITKSPSLIVTRSTAFTCVPRILRGFATPHLVGSSSWPVAKEMESPELESLMSLEQVPGLQHLTLSNCDDKLFDTDHTWTAKWNHLDLRSSRISNAGLRWLAAQSRLQSISLDNCSIEESAGSRLPNFPSLRTFDAHSSRINRSFLSRIGENRALEHLVLHTSQLSTTLFDSLKGHPRLRVLIIVGDDARPSSAAGGDDWQCSLKDLSALEWLIFRKIDRLDLKLEELPSLHEVQFENKGAIVGGVKANYVELNQCVIRNCPNVRIQASIQLGSHPEQQIDSATRDLSLEIEGTEGELRQFLAGSKLWKGSGFWRLLATEGRAPLELLPSGIEHLDVASMANFEPLLLEGFFSSLASLSTGFPLESARVAEMVANLPQLQNLNVTIRDADLSLASHPRLKNLKLSVENSNTSQEDSPNASIEERTSRISLVDLPSLESLGIAIDHSNFALHLSELPSLSLVSDLGVGRPRHLTLKNTPALASLRLDARQESVQLEGNFTSLQQVNMWDVNTSVAIEALAMTRTTSHPLNQVNWRPGKESSRQVFELLGESRCIQLTIQSVDLDHQDLASLFRSSWQGRSVRFLNCGFLDRASSSSESSNGIENPASSATRPVFVEKIVLEGCDVPNAFALGLSGRVRCRHLDISKSKVDAAVLASLLDVDNFVVSRTVLPGSTTNRPSLTVHFDQCNRELLDHLKGISAEVHVQILGSVPSGWQMYLPQHYLTDPEASKP